MTATAEPQTDARIEELNKIQALAERAKRRLAAPQELAELYDELADNAVEQILRIRQLTRVAEQYSSHPVYAVKTLLQDALLSIVRDEERDHPVIRFFYKEKRTVMTTHPLTPGHWMLEELCDRCSHRSSQPLELYGGVLGVYGNAVRAHDARAKLAQIIKGVPETPDKEEKKVRHYYFYLSPQPLAPDVKKMKETGKVAFLPLTLDTDALEAKADSYRQKAAALREKTAKLGPAQVQAMQILLESVRVR